MTTTELTGNIRYAEMQTYALTQPESSVVHGLVTTLEDLEGFENCVVCVFVRFEMFKNVVNFHNILNILKRLLHPARACFIRWRVFVYAETTCVKCVFQNVYTCCEFSQHL